MVSTTSETVAPPRSVTLAASLASSVARLALSAVCFTMAVIWSMLEAVSPSEAACCSVRCDRSRLPLAISLAATATLSAELVMPWMVLTRLSRMAFMLAIRLPVSPARVAMLADRSPVAMRAATSLA